MMTNSEFAHSLADLMRRRPHTEALLGDQGEQHRRARAAEASFSAYRALPPLAANAPSDEIERSLDALLAAAEALLYPLLLTTRGDWRPWQDFAASYAPTSLEKAALYTALAREAAAGEPGVLEHTQQARQSIAGLLRVEYDAGRGEWSARPGLPRLVGEAEAAATLSEADLALLDEVSERQLRFGVGLLSTADLRSPRYLAREFVSTMHRFGASVWMMGPVGPDGLLQDQAPDSEFAQELINGAIQLAKAVYFARALARLDCPEEWSYLAGRARREGFNMALALRVQLCLLWGVEDETPARFDGNARYARLVAPLLGVSEDEAEQGQFPPRWVVVRLA
jgi:hypothetical protein